MARGGSRRVRSAGIERSWRAGPVAVTRPFVVLERRWVVERSFGWLVHWGGLLRDRAGRLDVSTARVALAAVLSGVEALINPLPIQEPIRDHVAFWHSLRTMRRTEAQRRNASAVRLRHSQSWARRRHRLSQAMVLSTIQRFGSTTNLWRSERLTISTLTWPQTARSPAWNFAPW